MKGTFRRWARDTSLIVRCLIYPAVYLCSLIKCFKCINLLEKQVQWQNLVITSDIGTQPQSTVKYQMSLIFVKYGGNGDSGRQGDHSAMHL